MTRTPGGHSPGNHSAERRLKIAAVCLLGLPALGLAALALAEVTGGEPSGVQHILEAAPLLLLMAAGLRFPRPTGILMIALAAVLCIAWLAFVLPSKATDSDTPLLVWVGIGVVLFGLPFVSGLLFVISADLTVDRR